MNILLVDDEEDSRSYLATFLKKMGHQVVEAGDGKQGWETFKDYDFHLILSDIRMPGWTGLDLLKLIRKQFPLPECDVVLFTAYTQVQMAVEALRDGAYDYLLKPVNIKELIGCLVRVEEHQKMKRQNCVLAPLCQEQLEVVIEETSNDIKILDTPFLLSPESNFILPRDQFLIEAFMDRIINEALQLKNGNISKTATYLGISRRSLDYRLNKKASNKPYRHT